MFVVIKKMRHSLFLLEFSLQKLSFRMYLLLVLQIYAFFDFIVSTILVFFFRGRLKINYIEQLGTTNSFISHACNLIFRALHPLMVHTDLLRKITHNLPFQYCIF